MNKWNELYEEEKDKIKAFGFLIAEGIIFLGMYILMLMIPMFFLVEPKYILFAGFIFGFSNAIICVIMYFIVVDKLNRKIEIEFE